MDLPHDLQRAVFRLSRSLRVGVDQTGVSSSEAMLLANIRKTPGIGVTELALLDGVGRSVISERVTKLQAAGLIQRAKLNEGADQRRVGLSLTSAGRKTFAAVAAHRRNLIEQRLLSLTTDQRSVLERAVPLLDVLAGIDVMTEKAKSGRRAHE